MTLEQTLQNEIKESNRWNEIEKDESTYKRDLKKDRIDKLGSSKHETFGH